MMRRWKIVSKPDCKWCARAKAHLAVRGIEFDVFTHHTIEQQLAFKEDSGFTTYPQIWDGEKHVGGFTELKEYLP